eukprot:11336203-Alexandrium_andersonii.AAC.1
MTVRTGQLAGADAYMIGTGGSMIYLDLGDQSDADNRARPARASLHRRERCTTGREPQFSTPTASR